MCDTSKYVGVVLGQRKYKKVHAIYYVITKEELLLVVVLGIDKFRLYLVASRITAFSIDDFWDQTPIFFLELVNVTYSFHQPNLFWGDHQHNLVDCTIKQGFTYPFILFCACDS